MPFPQLISTPSMQERDFQMWPLVTIFQKDSPQTVQADEKANTKVQSHIVEGQLERQLRV